MRTPAGILRKNELHLHLPGRFSLLIFAVAVALTVTGYLITSSRVHGIGFPLDDAWIYQTYARNLGQLGEWAFVPGQPSAGSTAPLWSVLLAIGYFLNLPPTAWTFLLGSLSLLGLAWVGQALFYAFRAEAGSQLPWVGLFLIAEWHLAWAAVSGMETLLFSLSILLAFWLIRQARGVTWLAVGFLIGLSVWVRPDGITLLGPAGLVLLFSSSGWRERGRGLSWLLFGFLLFFAPYLFFNWKIQGSIWPNTFYAKQAEYAVTRQLPLLVRFLNQLSLPLIGAGFFLTPGFVTFAWQALKKRQWAGIGFILWFLGYALLYALRLPVTYQYGRYFMPAMPVYFVIGLIGAYSLVPLLRARKISWLLARVWLISGALVWLAFYGIGAGRYAQDVAIIDTEMVASAKWVAANTQPDALIAVHDIGAMGYFGNRKLVDLAGLVSPEVIPFIRDEDQISKFLDQKKVNYLVVFPTWYSRLADGRPLVFQTQEQFSKNAGGENMAIYRWSP